MEKLYSGNRKAIFYLYLLLQGIIQTFFKHPQLKFSNWSNLSWWIQNKDLANLKIGLYKISKIDHFNPRFRISGPKILKKLITKI